MLQYLKDKIGKEVDYEVSSLPSSSKSLNDNIIRPLKVLEKEAIHKAIEYCENNITRAAKLLEISKATILIS